MGKKNEVTEYFDKCYTELVEVLSITFIEMSMFIRKKRLMLTVYNNSKTILFFYRPKFLFLQKILLSPMKNRRLLKEIV